uniref:Uncharacterized protein n=1 Tax=Seriola lalandi dorsalis TaxID=1841481 RepID=A0A3B4WUH8_SERLL
MLLKPVVSDKKPTGIINYQFFYYVLQEFFVEDVQNLFDTGCGDMFFCKVHDILLKHENITKRKDEGELVRNLNVFISRKNVNCTELLKDVTPTGNQIQIPRLMELLTKCIKQRNWIGGNKR